MPNRKTDDINALTLTAKLERLEANEANRVAWCRRHRVNPDTGDQCGNYKAAIAACKKAIAEARKLAECQ